THSPPFFSATRMRPESRSSRTCSTASFTPAGALAGVISARFSKAASMTCCMSLMDSPLLDESGYAARGLDGILDRGNECHPDHAASRVHPVRLPPDEAAGQHGDVGVREQLAREGEV